MDVRQLNVQDTEDIRSMKAFVTGHRGYIGVHLVELLQSAGYEVTGCDLGLFDGCQWESLPAADRDLTCDIRTLSVDALRGHDVVCHLAAISNDPMGDLDAGLTAAVNRDGSIHLANIAKRAGVPRFLFSGSCSVYGKGERLDLVEGDPLRPLTAYARSKVEAEQAIANLADDDFSPTFLRNATAYGHSPMLRIDLVVNNLLAAAIAYGEIRVRSDGTPWRPLIHCRDIARAFVAFATAPRETVHNEIVNIGANSENYQVCDVANEVQRRVPEASLAFTGEAGDDPRNYRVNFDKLQALLPDFACRYTVTSGLEELHAKYLEHGFSRHDFEGSRFTRLRTLRSRFERLLPTKASAGARAS